MWAALATWTGRRSRYANGGGDWSAQLNGKRQRPDDDDHVGGGGDVKPPRQSFWGATAQQNGILANADHTRIAFGDWVVQCGSPADCKEYCVAAYAPSKKTEERNKWCISPAKCWSAWGPQAHARPNGFPDELPKDKLEEKDRAELTVVRAGNIDCNARVSAFIECNARMPGVIECNAVYHHSACK